jgi:hypothetical protein
LVKPVGKGEERGSEERNSLLMKLTLYRPTEGGYAEGNQATEKEDTNRSEVRREADGEFVHLTENKAQSSSDPVKQGRF